MLSEILLLIIICLFVINYLVSCGKKGKYLHTLPGPPAYPIIGNAFMFAKLKKPEIWPMILNCNELYYPLWRIWGLHLGAAIILKPEDIEILLRSPKYIKKSLIYRFVQSWLQTGLLTSSGEKWFQRRKMLTPAFHFNVLQKYVQVMNKYGQQMINNLNSFDKAVTIDLNSFLTNYTLSVICEAAMGTSLQDIEAKQTNEYRKAVYDLGEIAVYRFLNMWQLPLLNNFFFNYFTSMGWKHRKIVKLLHKFSTKIINERKEYHGKTNGKYLMKLDSQSVANEPTENEIHDGPKTMLDILISAHQKNKIDDIGIREEVDTFIFEGHDTSAMALMFSIQLIAQHTEIQAKAREEVNEIWTNCNGNLGMSELNKMAYLERCIKESLRLYPSVPFISRHLEQDLHLKDNIIIPKGVVAVVIIYDLHRNARLWPEPNKYDPDRFLPETSTNRHPYSYIPFSAGPRNCIGQKFALMELKMFCAHLLHSFYLEAVELHEDFEHSPDLVLRPEKKIHVKFIPIES